MSYHRTAGHHERTVAMPDAPAPAATEDGDGRTVTVRIIGWDEPSRVTDDGRTFYEESFAPGGLVPAPDAMLVRAFGPEDRPGRHAAPVVGRLVATEARQDGLYGVVRLARTAAGLDLAAMLDPDVRVVEHVSIEFDDDAPPPPPGGSIRRTNAVLTGLAFTPYPQHNGSRVLAARSNPEVPTVEDEETPTEPETPDETPEPEGEPEGGAPAARTAGAPARQHARTAPRPGAGAGGGRFRSFGEFARSAARGELTNDQLAAYHRALADLTTPTAGTAIAGRETWITEVIDLMRGFQATIEAFATRPLPDTGLDIAQPIVTTRPAVGKQATQKTEITSGPFVIDKVTWDVETYAGGNDVSLQVIQRADTIYLNELMRLYAQQLAIEMNADAAAAVLAAADTVNTALEWTDAEGFNANIIDAAAVILTTLRRFPEVAVLSVDLWKALGKLVDSDGRPVYPSINPMNSAGTFSVTDRQGNVRDLQWTVEPEFTGITAVVGVREAFRTMRGPVGTLTADVPAKLGRDVAVYQFAAMGVADASGLVLIENATP